MSGTPEGQTTEAEYEAPDEITLEVLLEVREAMAFRRPVAPNTIFRCLGWAAQRIAELEGGVLSVAEFAQKVAKLAKEPSHAE